MEILLVIGGVLALFLFLLWLNNNGKPPRNGSATGFWDGFFTFMIIDDLFDSFGD